MGISAALLLLSIVGLEYLPFAQPAGIVHNHCVLHGTEFLKLLAQVLCGYVEEEVADVQGGLRYRAFAHILTFPFLSLQAVVLWRCLWCDRLNILDRSSWTAFIGRV